MTGVGIYDGDEVIVDRAIDPRDGHIVIAVVDGEMTMKRLRTSRGRAILAAEAPGYPDIHVPELSELRIWGVVVTSLHNVLRT